jgi:hypothetical protein
MLRISMIYGGKLGWFIGWQRIMGSNISCSVCWHPLLNETFAESTPTAAAMGCGAYRCPPHVVAEEMKSILLEPEFKGWFRQVVFAIYSRKGNGPGNYDIFKEVFEGVRLS